MHVHRPLQNAAAGPRHIDAGGRHDRRGESAVEVPRTTERTDPAPAPRPVTDDSAPAANRVLVVDDHQDAAMSLAMLIEIMGHEVQTAHDGVEALEVAEAFRPDVILLDIGMPRMNGYEASRRIRATDWGGSVRLIALTGWGQEEDVRRSAEAGFDHHLVKPVEAEALREALS